MVSRPLIDILLFWNLFNWTIIIYIMLRTPLSSTLLLSPFPFPESQCPHSANKQQGPVCHSNTPLPGTGLLSLSYASSDVGTQKVVSFSCLWLPTPQWITLVSAGSVTFYDPWNIYLTFKSHTQLLTNYCIFFSAIFDPVSLSGRVCSFFWPSLEQNYYTMKLQLWVEERQSWNLLSSASLLGYLKEAGFVGLCINPGQWEPLMPWLLPINPKRNSHVVHYPRGWVHLHLLIVKTTWSRCSPREMQAGPWAILPSGALSLEY